jgi:diketogulonate reductase-like aldo/keto reductase
VILAIHGCVTRRVIRDHHKNTTPPQSFLQAIISSILTAINMSPIYPIPPVGLGSFRLKGEAVKQVVRDAIRIGYRHIDTAAIYRNEKDIGAVLQETYNNPSNTLTRSDFWITSKLSPYDMKNPRGSLLQSLRSLQTDYLDLYLIHWPAVARKTASSLEHKALRLEAWRVLNEAKSEGLLRHVGVSNFTPQHIQELVDETEYEIQGAFVQMEIHPWYWRDALEIQTRFAEEGVRMVGYALLAEGRLVGENCPEVLDKISERLGLSKVQVVLAWALSKKWGVLVRSGNVDHLRENLEVASLVDVLTSKDIAVIDGISSRGAEEKLCWDPRHVK